MGSHFKIMFIEISSPSESLEFSTTEGCGRLAFKEVDHSLNDEGIEENGEGAWS